MKKHKLKKSDNLPDKFIDVTFMLKEISADGIL